MGSAGAEQRRRMGSAGAVHGAVQGWYRGSAGAVQGVCQMFNASSKGRHTYNRSARCQTPS